MGGIRITMPVNGHGLFRITKRARRQIGIWLMLNMFAWAANQVLGVFSHLTEEGSRITGATYTTVNATIPVTFIMAAITAILGVILGLWIMKSHTLEGSAPIAARASEALKAWKVPTVAIASAIVVSLVLTVAWPVLLQRFRVNPNAQEMESTYIQRNIDATRAAYGFGQGEGRTVQGHHQASPERCRPRPNPPRRSDCSNPQVVSPTFKQLQQSKQYYTFADTLAVDKYDIDGVSQDTVIAARELDLEGNDNRNWVKRPHRVYAWVRCRGRIRQQGGGGRAAAVLRIQHPHPGQAHRIAEVRAAHLLLPERPRILDCRGSEGHGFVGVRLSDRIAGRDQYV